MFGNRESFDGRPPLCSWPIAVEQDNWRSQLGRNCPGFLTRLSEVHIPRPLVGNARKDVPILLADCEGNNRDTRRAGDSAGDCAGEKRLYRLPQAKTSAAVPNGEM